MRTTSVAPAMVVAAVIATVANGMEWLLYISVGPFLQAPIKPEVPPCPREAIELDSVVESESIPRVIGRAA